MDVVIVGAGLGGLCLAQGLRQRGIGVTVLEADPALEARKQGYRLNINVSGASALAACLPDSLLRLYQATSHRQLEPTVTMYTPHFEPVFQRIADAGEGALPPSAVDRATLRRILAAVLALGAWDPRQDPGAASVQDPAYPDLSMARPYLMWVMMGPPGLLGLTATGPAGLHERACALISDWDGGAWRAVLAAQVQDTFLVRIRCSPRVPDWLSGRATFLGDAVHTMTPAGGEGANTAMRDAAALAANLVMRRGHPEHARPRRAGPRRGCPGPATTGGHAVGGRPAPVVA